MPNHIGAFLKASKCFSMLGINITRVSYNKAVDSHTLFIDAEGTKQQLQKAVANEEYEQAAKFRDAIRALNLQLEQREKSIRVRPPERIESSMEGGDFHA